jgi:hypothetical protein
MRYALWIVQGLLAALFLFAGGVKLIMPVEEMTKDLPLPACSCDSSPCAKYWARSA